MPVMAKTGSDRTRMRCAGSGSPRRRGNGTSRRVTAYRVSRAVMTTADESSHSAERRSKSAIRRSVPRPLRSTTPSQQYSDGRRSKSTRHRARTPATSLKAPQLGGRADNRRPAPGLTLDGRAYVTPDLLRRWRRCGLYDQNRRKSKRRLTQTLLAGRRAARRSWALAIAISGDGTGGALQKSSAHRRSGADLLQAAPLPPAAEGYLIWPSACSSGLTAYYRLFDRGVRQPSPPWIATAVTADLSIVREPRGEVSPPRPGLPGDRSGEIRAAVTTIRRRGYKWPAVGGNGDGGMARRADRRRLRTCARRRGTAFFVSLLRPGCATADLVTSMMG